MKLLLDAHTLLWFLADDAKLSVAAKAALIGRERSAGHEVWITRRKWHRPQSTLPVNASGLGRPDHRVEGSPYW
jgi:hypothetical protein